MKSFLHPFRQTRPPLDPCTYGIDCSHDHTTSPSPSEPTAIIELFQSQGCNSCPPTNANLLALAAADPKALLLTYHVTYWDYLGWTDVFGLKDADARQRDYVRRLGLRSAYTPMVVVGGRGVGVGNTRAGLEKVVREGAGQGRVEVGVVKGREGGDTVVSVGGKGKGAMEVTVVWFDPRGVDVRIEKGENGGEVLPHRNVVRRVRRLGGVEAGQEGVFVLDAGADRLEAVVLVQDGVGGSIVGFAKV